MTRIFFQQIRFGIKTQTLFNFEKNTMYMHALHALFCILFSCTAFSMQNYKVISNVKFVSLDSFHKVLETSSLMECAMFGSSNLYFSVEFNNQTKTCIPSKCFRNTIKSIGTSVLQLQEIGMYITYIVLFWMISQYLS